MKNKTKLTGIELNCIEIAVQHHIDELEDALADHPDFDSFDFNNGINQSGRRLSGEGLGFSAPVRPPKPRKPRPVSTIQFSYYEVKLEKNGEKLTILLS